MTTGAIKSGGNSMDVMCLHDGADVFLFQVVAHGQDD
jgi:hypothetical protein